MATRRTKRLLSELKGMQNEAGERLYDRVSKAKEVFADKEWVSEVGGEKSALKLLATEYFADLCGAMSMVRLFEIRDLFPSKEAWKERDWDLRAMLAEIREAEDVDRRRRRSCTLAQYEQLKTERDQLQVLLESEKRETERLRQQVNGLDQQLSQTRTELEQLRGENRALKERVESAESLARRAIPRAVAG